MTIKHFFLFIGLMMPVIAFCQPQVQSPYSKFGLGDFRSGSVLSAQSMGGLSAIYHDQYNLNPLNPASFAFLKATSFDIGVSAQSTNIKSKADDASVNSISGSLDNINLGLSLVNDYNRELEGRKSDWRFGMGLGLSQYTKVGYDIKSDATVDDIHVNYSFQGHGGSYQVNWANAAKYKNLAVGLNVGFLLGQVSESQVDFFEDTISHYYNNKFSKDYSYKGTSFKLGAIWDYKFKDKSKENGLRGDYLTIGGYIQPSYNLKTTFTEEIYRFGQAGVDTIYSAKEAQHTSKHPSLFSFGVGYGFSGLYRLGVNVEAGNWDQYESGFKKLQMGKANRYSIGYEKSSDLKAYESYWKKMAFRTGAFYGNDPRFVNGKQIRYYGITIGGGFPVIIPRQDISFVNLGLEIGQSGIPTDIDKMYVKFSMSFSLTDKSWFFKQKYY